MTVQHPPTWSARISWIKRIGMPATNNLILEKSLGTIYLSLCIWKIFGGESGFWNNNWNHPLKDKHLFHLFLNKRNRDLFLRRAPGGSFFETFHKRCRRRRRRCSVQVSFSWLPPDHNVRQYPIEQSLFFFLPPPPFGAVYIMRLLVSHFEFFFLRKQKWRTLFSPQKFPMGYLYFESNRRWIDQVDGYMAAQVGVAAGSWSMTQGRKKNPKMIQWVFVERIIAVEKTKITFRPFGIK
jgi:hypothetical protein